MHAIGPAFIAGLSRALDLAERDYQGLVIWSPDDPFSVGLDLQALLPVFMSGGAKALEPEARKMHEVMLRLRYAQVPTVAAVAGMALGGGCELAVNCARRVAHLESYIGLVEVGVGLIPAGGGLPTARAARPRNQAAAPDANLLAFLLKYVMAAGTAQVSKSAIEAQAMGYLLPERPHRVQSPRAALRGGPRGQGDERCRLSPATRRARSAVAGRGGIATITAQLSNMRDGGFISAHDEHLGRTIAEVMCGGDVDAGSMVDEAWLMALERRAFVGLLTTPRPRSGDGHDADRQAGSQLRPEENSHEQTSTGCLHRRRDAHADRQGPEGHVPQRAARRPAGARHPWRAGAGALARSGHHRGRDRRLRDTRGRAGPEHGAHRRAAGGLPNTVGGVTVNRFCASGLTARGDGRRPHPRRRGRCDDRRGRRVDEHGADDGQHAVDQPGRLRP
jgi:enoyl-CoA hydratase/carnithine racemase